MKTFSITDTGRRREMNQDYIYTSERPVGNLPNLFIVADGMGGHNAGDYASRYAVESMIKIAEEHDMADPAVIFRDMLHTANENLVRMASKDASLQGMGTTAVIAAVNNDHLHVANVGDSRLYIINDEIRQITKDHSLVGELVRRGEIEKEAAREHPDRHIITRAVGATGDVLVDIFEVVLKSGDQILLCTDGLTDMIEDNEIRNIVNSQRDIAEKVEKLVFAANDNGGYDNITAIVIEPFSDEVKLC